MKKAMTKKRFKKLDHFFIKEDVSGYELINENAKKIIVTM
jgi:hypothetical protein